MIYDPLPRPAPPETLDDQPPVRALMSRRVVAIVPTAPLSTALQLMVAEGVRHLPVMEDGRCTGMVTETDVLRGLAARRGPWGTADLRVLDVVRTAPAVVESTPVGAAATVMLQERTDAVLVVGADGGIAGIVTATDLVHALARG
ncbi:CBS domain-containing protein [Pseudonocardia xishanensis]|uniref:CBS domain-containing protein n=1 Tax=Pseudonocardia xishanensis TaxID=630995 RepID=A0ABP8RLR3_9PSEU